MTPLILEWSVWIIYFKRGYADSLRESPGYCLLSSGISYYKIVNRESPASFTWVEGENTRPLAPESLSA